MGEKYFRVPETTFKIEPKSILAWAKTLLAWVKSIGFSRFLFFNDSFTDDLPKTRVFVEEKRRENDTVFDNFQTISSFRQASNVDV